MTARELYGSVYEGVPDSTAVPTALPTTDGLLPALVLVLNLGVTDTEIREFAARHRFVPGDETARAVNSQARWSLEPDGRLADRHGVTVWAWASPYTGGWEIDWERSDGAPTKEQVARELTDDPAAGAYASEITLCPAWGRITRRARALLQPDAAVILDTRRPPTCTAGPSRSP
ncbi:hypothetical protein ACIBBE_24850 [Streptomyces sp. NPDC051644]|uniref:hypothetical protein n=1 Tax=Streptomyces sp. NPDC051644 TaxID=3365666 RepID=UPI0037928A47